MIREFYHLTKPGIVRGNAMTAFAGFFLASKGSFDLVMLFAAIVGLSLVISSACVFNNVIDRDIDKKMKRTKKRAVVVGKISITQALVFASLLLLIGSLLLFVMTNVLALCIALFGHFAYVVLYGYAKRKSVFGTEVGSISGAVPPVVGYVAVTGSVDSAAILLFILLVFWQMPHFYAIGIMRIADYRAANIPILPIKRGLKITMNRILMYVALFVITIPWLSIFGYTGLGYLFVMLPVSIVWFYRGLKGYRAQAEEKWAGGMFGYSLIVLITFSVMISLNAWIP